MVKKYLTEFWRERKEILRRKKRRGTISEKN
jgi:hypothetical protein